MKLTDYKALMELGYKEHTARNIIRQAKNWLIESGYDLYRNKSCCLVPTYAVEKIIGIDLKEAN